MTDCKNVILVTGATRGIGKSIACSVVCSVSYIVGTATSEQGAESITNYMRELKINGIFLELLWAIMFHTTRFVRPEDSKTIY